ncbi:MAG: efflux RND transporter permease subunit [Pseudomonadota bacterium]
MTGVVDWAASRARMVLAFIFLSITAGVLAYTGLPKEGEPDIEIPAVFISLPFPGISAADAETLLVKPMETELAEIDGLDSMTGTAAEGYANIVLEFEFGWDKTQVMADVRDAMDKASAEFPAGWEQYTLDEFNFSEFPIVIVSLSGPVPERTMTRVAKDLQDDLEGLEPVLDAAIVGSRDEMLEVVIDPLRLEAYNVTAGELITVVQNNNQLIAAGEIDTEQGSFAVKIPSSFDEALDVYNLPVKTNGDRVVTLGDLAQINLTFEDRTSTARFNGDATVALQVSKRKGFNLIDTSTLVRETVAERQADWPEGLKATVEVQASNDQSRQVSSMVSQLEGSVLTAIILVMLVSLAALGIRASLLVGFAIPTSFLLCFVLLGLMGISVSNIVMFGLILSVGMLVDGAIVVTEYADKRQQDGVGPMRSYVEAAKRMFWPVVSSTATTLCAFMPMLFWPGVPGEFMGMLPVTLIFVLSASLIVALIYLPVMGGMLARLFNLIAATLVAIARMPLLAHVLLIPVSILPLVAAGALVPGLLAQISVQFGVMDGQDIWGSVVPIFGTVFLLALGAVILSALALAGAICLVLAIVAILPRIGINIGALWTRVFGRRERRVKTGARRTAFGRVIEGIVANPVMPLVMVGAVFVFVGTTMIFFVNNNRGVEFFVESEPEQAIVYVMARGNLSLPEKDALLREAEEIVGAHPGIDTVFAFAGDGGLNSNTGGAQSPKDTIGQMQVETIPWEDRPNTTELWFTMFGMEVNRVVKDPAFDGDVVLAEITAELNRLPGVKTEILDLAQGPASAKPVHLRVKGDNFDDLVTAAGAARGVFDATPGLTLIEDTRPLPGIDWEISVDVEKAGRFGADVATVGAMVQLVTRGILLDTYTPEGGDEEIEIRVRLPESDRVLSTLDTLKVRTSDGLVPLANFITRTPVPSLAQISRIGQERYFDVKADVLPGLQKIVRTEAGTDGAEVQVTVATLSPDTNGAITLEDGSRYLVLDRTEAGVDLQAGLDAGDLRAIPVNPNERIAEITKWLETDPFAAGLSWEWTGDQEDQAESQAFLMSAFGAALGLMFIILLAQFNSIYNAVLVLLAVVLSTTGVLIGMVVMDQAFSIIMTGTGIVALAGIVVNNNIVLIDTYQEYEKYMPRIEAIIRTAQDRIRPVLLTTITTMAGLAPMMFGLSLDFVGGGYTVDSPTALWWKQLATAVVFGLGVATVLTLMVTPSLLAARIWAGTYAKWIAALLARLSMGRASRAARDWALERDTARLGAGELIWDDGPAPEAPIRPQPQTAPLRAAE